MKKLFALLLTLALVLASVSAFASTPVANTELAYKGDLTLMHFSTSDKLDGVVDPYGIKSTGLFKNRDCFSALQLTLTYSFMAKCKTCNNDKDD